MAPHFFGIQPHAEIRVEIAAEADLPPGVVNVLAGGPSIGQAIVEHDGIDKIAFTGSTEVGKIIQRSVAASGKRLTLELGGKAANIVFDDAPIDEAVEGIVNGIFFNQGQVCCAGSRLLVQESIVDELTAALQRRLATLRVGDPLDKNTDVGAINSAAALARIRELTAAGVEEGATRWSPPCELPERGFWFAPTVFTGVSPAHRIAREEIFGPVLSIMPYDDEEDAVRIANDSLYGLAGGVWSGDEERAKALARRIRTGQIEINGGAFNPLAPFGGYKQSGNGRELGPFGIEEFLQIKSLQL